MFEQRGYLAFNDKTRLDWLDSQEWYRHTLSALDVISLVGAGTASASALKTYFAVRASSSRSSLEILKGMDRAERKRLTEEIIRLNHPGVSNKALKQMIRSGDFPKRYADSRINEALVIQIKNALGASFSFGGSALGGVTNSLVVGIYEEITDKE